MHRPPIPRPHGALRPGRWQRRLLAVSALLLALTGAAWLALHYSIGAGTGELPHPAEPWLLRLHGLGAFAALFAGGVIAGHHLPAGWRASHRPRHAGQRGSGTLACTLFALAAASGYVLFYFAPEDWRPAIGWGHALVASALLAVAVRHARRARWVRQRAPDLGPG